MENNGRKIRVAYLLPTLDQGGAERFFVDLILRLDPDYFSPHLFLYKRGGEWMKELETRGIPVSIFRKKTKICPAHFFRLSRAIKKFAPDIIHTELGGDIYGRLIGRLLGAKNISTEQNVNKGEPLLIWLGKKLTMPLADRVVAISQAVQTDLPSRYGTKPEKITLIYNGLPLEKFLIEAGNRPRNERLVFGTLGRLTPQKGQATLIEAWSKLAKPRPLCLIAGQGELRESLEKQIADLDLKNDVKLVGPIQKTSDFFSSLDAFILPSLWEGLGIVLLEAGLVSRPIIASAVDGVTEIIDKDTGYLVPPGDARALSDAVERLIKNIDQEETKIMTRRLREKISDRFDISKIAVQYQELYQNILNKE